MDEMKRKSHEVIEKDLEDYMEKTPEISRNFRSWLRRFHSEYNDPWFEKNFRRLEISFRPIWEGRANDGMTSEPNGQIGLEDLLL